MWIYFKSIAPTLDELQQRCKGVGDKCTNDAAKLAKYWEKVATNLLELSQRLKEYRLVSVILAVILYSWKTPWGIKFLQSISLILQLVN